MCVLHYYCAYFSNCGLWDYTWNLIFTLIFLVILCIKSHITINLFDISKRSEVSAQARESFSMAFGRIFCVSLNFLFYSLQRLRPRHHVLLSQKLWAPSRWSCKAYKLYGLATLCLPGKSMFMRQKMIAPSWPKVVHPVADTKDVARCGLSIGVFLASLFHN